MYDIAWADGVDLERAEEIIDFEIARATDNMECFNPLPGKKDAPTTWCASLGTWRMDWQGQCAVLIRVPVLCATPGEQEWDYALQYPETQQYIRWMQEGIMPPPVAMLRNVDGKLTLNNRRRWLAARAAGIETWSVWYWGPCHEEFFPVSRWWFPEKVKFYVNQYQLIVDAGMDPARSLEPFVMRRLLAAGIAA